MAVRGAKQTGSDERERAVAGHELVRWGGKAEVRLKLGLDGAEVNPDRVQERLDRRQPNPTWEGGTDALCLFSGPQGLPGRSHWPRAH